MKEQIRECLCVRKCMQAVKYGNVPNINKVYIWYKLLFILKNGSSSLSATDFDQSPVQCQ